MNAPHVPPRRRRAALLGVALTTALLTSGLSLAPASAEPATTGSVRGTVLADGVGVPHVDVTLEPLSGSCGNACATRTTDSVGSYLFPDLPSGSYRLKMTPPLHTSGRPFPGPQYSGRTYSAADAVSFDVNSTEVAREDTLLHGGSIAGLITDDDGNPLPDIAVTHVDVSPGVFDPPGRTAHTDATGSFTLGGIRPGEHSLYLREAKPEGQVWAAEYYSEQGGTGGLGTADKLVVVEDQAVEGLRAALAPGGSISGQLTTSGADGSVRPVGGISVHALPVTSGGRLGFVSSGTTDDQGRYVVSGLRAEPTAVSFRDRSGTYATQSYRGAYGVPITPVAVSPGATTTGIDDVLSLGADIRGVVTAADGSPVGGVFVNAVSGTGISAGAWSQPDGRYSLPTLPPGSYRLRFGQGSTGIFYKDAARSCDATLVTLAPPTDADAVDQQLPEPGTPAVDHCPSPPPSPSSSPMTSSPAASPVASPTATDVPATSPSPSALPGTASGSASPSPSADEPVASTSPSPVTAPDTSPTPSASAAVPTAPAPAPASPTAEASAGPASTPSTASSPATSAAPVEAPAATQPSTSQPAPSAAPASSPAASSSTSPAAAEAAQRGVASLPADATAALQQAVTTALNGAASAVSGISTATPAQQSAAVDAVAAVAAHVAGNAALTDAQRAVAVETAAALAGVLATLPSSTTVSLQKGLADGLDTLSTGALGSASVQAAVVQSVTQTVAVLLETDRGAMLTRGFVEALLTATGEALASGVGSGSTGGVRTSTSLREDGRLAITLGSLEPGSPVVVVLNLPDPDAPALLGALRNGTPVYGAASATARTVAVAGTVGPDGAVTLVSPAGVDVTTALRAGVLTVVGSARGGQQAAFADQAAVFATPEVPTLTLQPAAAERGRPVTASGTATPGSVVRLYARPFGGAYSQIRQAVVPASGHWSFLLRPERNTRILVRSAGARGASTVEGPSAVAVVDAAVSQGARRVAPATYAFSGRVAPAGAGTVVRVTGHTEDGVLVVVGTARTSADGTWRLTRRFLSAVTLATVAHTRADGRSGSGKSSPLRFAIH